MKNNITLVIGGCRSGKSSHALILADSLAGEKKLFIATSVPTDSEMEERVVKHQQERGPGWETAEIPVEIARTIDGAAKTAKVILVDCLTLWTSNLMMEGLELPAIHVKLQELSSSLQLANCPVILVSNEVGAGIVPENRLARKFRDIAGFVNQKIAATADRVIWMVAGIPVNIKPGQEQNLPGA